MKYSKLWTAAEVLLFVLVGATVDLQYVAGAGLAAVALIFGALIFRMAGVTVCLLKTPLDVYKRQEHGQLLRTIVIGSPFHGEAASITASPDQAFAEKMMGDGATVVPCEGVVTAPCDAEISFVFDTQHALGLKLEEDIDCLLYTSRSSRPPGSG